MTGWSGNAWLADLHRTNWTGLKGTALEALEKLISAGKSFSWLPAILPTLIGWLGSVVFLALLAKRLYNIIKIVASNLSAFNEEQPRNRDQLVTELRVSLGGGEIILKNISVIFKKIQDKLLINFPLNPNILTIEIMILVIISPELW